MFLFSISCYDEIDPINDRVALISVYEHTYVLW